MGINISNVDCNETESAASEEGILTEVGVLSVINQAEFYKKLQNNKSGICQECNSKIPAARLEIFPNSNYCAPCQGKMDKLGGRAAPYRNTLPISAVFAKIEDEEAGDEETDNQEDKIKSEDLPADLNHALKVYNRDTKRDS